MGNDWKEKLRRRKDKGKMKKVFSTCFVLMTFLSATNASAAGTNIPGAATPGGALPKMQKQEVPAESMPAVVIPPLRERPMSAEEGAKIIVNRFELEGVVERPGMISVGEVKELVEKQRQKYPAGMTMGQMQLVADEVMNYYRNHGLILARAFISAQTVTSNVVKITIMEGKLGTVHAEGGSQLAASKDPEKAGAAGNLRYPKEVLEEPFQSLIGQPVIKDELEGALLQLLDYPGLKYNAVIKPGAVEGTADLYLNVTDERLFKAALSVDNYGSDFTGEYRPRLDLVLNNPTKAADKLQVVLIDTLKPNNELYGGFSYERPIPGDRNSVGVDFFRNTFDIGDNLKQFQLAGTSETRDVFLKHVFKRTRKGGVSGLIRFASKTAETTAFDTTTSKDDLSVLSAETSADYLDNWFGGGMTNMSVTLAQGLSEFMGSNGDQAEDKISRIGGSRNYAPSDFFKLNAEYSRLQKLWPNTSLLFRLKGQATNSMLVSLEQFALGGPDTVRAYPQAEYMMDQGYFTSFELNFNAPGFADRPAFANRTWGELLQVSIFYDAAAGWLKDPLPNEEESGYLSGAGVGLHFALPGRFSSSLSVATPLGDHDAEDKREFRTFFNLSCMY